MKVLHISSLYSGINNIGVINQLEYESKASRKYNISMDTLFYCAENSLSNEFIRKNPKFPNLFILRRLYYLYKIIYYSKYYDAILFRYPIADIFFIFIYSRGAKLYSVHHTNELNLILSKYKGLKKYILYLIEYITGKILLKKVDGIIGVTDEIARIEIEGISSNKTNTSYPNGINLSNILERKLGLGKIRIIFLNTEYQKWQGLEELLENLKLNSSLSCKYTIHIVGKLSRNQLNLIDGARNIGIDIMYTPTIPENQISTFLHTFDLGLAAFYMDRVGLNEACTLKVRQYLNAGLLIYSGHVDSALPSTYPYYKIGRPNIKEILTFVEANKGLSNCDIQLSSEKYIDKGYRIKKLHKWLDDNA